MTLNSNGEYIAVVITLRGVVDLWSAKPWRHHVQMYVFMYICVRVACNFKVIDI